MQDGMVSTVRRIDERKDRYEATLLSVKEIAQETGGECAIDSTCVLERRDPHLSHQQNAAVRSGTSSANLFGERVVNDRTTTRRAIGGAAGDAHSRNAPVR